MNWNAENGIDDIELQFADDTTFHLGKVPVFCDMAFTTPLYTDKELLSVTVHVANPYVSVDAVMVSEILINQVSNMASHYILNMSSKMQSFIWLFVALVCTVNSRYPHVMAP